METDLTFRSIASKIALTMRAKVKGKKRERKEEKNRRKYHIARMSEK